MHFLRSLKRHILKSRKHTATIGGLAIQLPNDSRLPEFKRQFKLYDIAVKEIADIIAKKYPAFRAIDIGANVGDTAALILDNTGAEVLCIEGDPVLLPLLRANLAVCGMTVSYEPSFIGQDEGRIDPQKIGDLGRNSSILNAKTQSGSIKTRSFEKILLDHPKFRDSKLLKIDTEGCDFEILRQADELLSTARPVIFFEYAPHLNSNDGGIGLRTISHLMTLGYSTFLYFDNFGNFLAAATPEQPELFQQFHSYLASNYKFGVAVYYFDVCAFHETDTDLAVIAQNNRLATAR